MSRRLYSPYWSYWTQWRRRWSYLFDLRSDRSKWAAIDRMMNRAKPEKVRENGQAVTVKVVAKADAMVRVVAVMAAVLVNQNWEQNQVLVVVSGSQNSASGLMSGRTNGQEKSQTGKSSFADKAPSSNRDNGNRFDRPERSERSSIVRLHAETGNLKVLIKEMMAASVANLKEKLWRWP